MDQQAFGASMIELVVVTIIFIIVVNILSSINEDVNREPNEPSTEKGTIGLFIVVLAGIGFVYSVNALQSLGVVTYNEGGSISPDYSGVGSGKRQSKIGENIGLAGLVLGHQQGVKLKFKDESDHDYSVDRIREAEEEEIAREARAYRQQTIQQQRRIQDVPNTTNIYYINKPQRKPIIRKRKSKKNKIIKRKKKKKKKNIK